MHIDNRALALRPEVEQDKAFLERLHHSTRDDLLQLGLPDAMIANLMLMQFNAQQMGYRAQFPEGDFSIVERSGDPIGYLVTCRGDEVFRLVYIAFLPQERNQGHGRKLIKELQAKAANASQPLALSVARQNIQAKHLYLSLGFQVVLEDGAHLGMIWHAKKSQ